MSASIYVGGSAKGVGKTFVALGLLHLLSRNYKTAAWKPVDVGQMDYNAADLPGDGLRLHRAASMSEHPNLVNPFLLNEDLPPVLAARRDGITLKTKVLQHHFKQLYTHFERIVIEGGRSLYTPLTETEMEIEFFRYWNPRVVWVTNIGERELAETLLQLHALQQAKVEIVGIVLSNRLNSKNADLIFYQWLTLEEKTSVRVLALLPFLASGLNNPASIGELISEHFDRNALDSLVK